MSHATVMVKVTAKRLKCYDAAGANLEPRLNAALNDMMAPYCEQTKDPKYLEFHEDEDCDEVDPKTGKKGYWANPSKTWDWWVIGGRWTGFFPLKPNRQPTLGRSGAFGNEPRPGRGDIVTIGDLDLDAIAKETRESAEKFWKDWSDFLGGKKFDVFEGPRSQALSLGLLQVVQGHALSDANQKAISWATFVHAGDERASWHDVAKLIDRDAFLVEYIDCFNPIRTYAALDNDGWHAPGKLGWFGCSSDEPGDYVKFSREFVQRFVKTAAADDLLVVLDYHI